MKRIARSFALAFAAALIAVVVAAGAAPSFPALTGRVVDEAGILSSDTQSRLTALLAEHEQQTGHQVVVVTLKSLQGNDIADYGYQLGRAWGIGQKGKNTGALVIVAPNERKVRIEVGYGLEGILTDAQSKLIIENTILPYFKKGDYDSACSPARCKFCKCSSANPPARVRSRRRSRKSNMAAMAASRFF